MLWKDFFSFWCSAGLFHKGLSFLVHLQATAMVFCILPFFLLIPSGSLPPTVSGLSCANRCSSKGKDASPSIMVGLCGVTLCVHAGEVVENLILSALLCALFSNWASLQLNASLVCSLLLSVIPNSRHQIWTSTNVFFLIWCAGTSFVLWHTWDNVLIMCSTGILLSLKKKKSNHYFQECFKFVWQQCICTSLEIKVWHK